jgi:lipid-A-disaccharide synthase
MAHHIDHVLALLPFEPPYMEAAGMSCDFVGHPVVSEPQASESDAAAFRLKFGIGDSPLLMVLPGSRKSEVTRLSPIFASVLKEACFQFEDLKIVLPAARPMAGLVKTLVKSWHLSIEVLVLDPRDYSQDDGLSLKRAAFKAADLALAASGTVSLELAAAGTPMVIAYDMNPLSRFLISRMLRVDTANLVSLVSETRVIPEFLGKDCQPEFIAPAVIETLNNPSPQISAMRITIERLGSGGEDPGMRAAKAVLNNLNV